MIPRYGLILPQKKGASKTVLQKPSVFGDDSDDEVSCHHLVQVFAILRKVDRFLKDQKHIQVWVGILAVTCSVILHMLCFFSQTSVGESLQRESVKKKMMKQVRGKVKWLDVWTFTFLQFTFVSFLSFLWWKTRLEMQKALEQDSTVYDYDAVYDDIQNQRLENNKKILHGTDKRVTLLMLNMCFVNTGIWERSNGYKSCSACTMLIMLHQDFNALRCGVASLVYVVSDNCHR